MGRARCLSFRQQIHDENDEEHYDKYKRYDSIPFEESYGPYVQNQEKKKKTINWLRLILKLQLDLTTITLLQHQFQQAFSSKQLQQKNKQEDQARG
jgi:hypothetical protein